ncbi:MAG: glycosyltransferase family 2 protein [Bryobacteraceae bacterium]
MHEETVYEFAAYLAECYGCHRLLDLGYERVSSLVPLSTETGLAASGDHALGQHYAVQTCIPHDFERSAFKPPRRARASGSLLVCAGVMEHLVHSEHLLATLRSLLEDAPVAILTTRLRPRGVEDMEPPADSSGLRDWNLAEFRDLLEDAGLQVLFHGLLSSHDRDRQKRTILTVVRKPRPALGVPVRFRVVALVGAYNEEDVIVPFLEHTIGQGVDVCLLDNWSTDRTAERAARFLGRGLTAILKFPASGPTQTHEWRSMLTRKAELAGQTEADWFIHIDPDEIRESPWPGLTLREALYRVDQEGFNAVGHTCLVFHPTGGDFCPDLPLQSQFSHFEFGARGALNVQIKAWKRQLELVDCASYGGHFVQFPGRRVYPFKFLLRHYPIRSQEHGERKVFRERLPRFSPALRQEGWHIQYDGLGLGHSFVRNPDTLLPFNPRTFYEEYLIERLSGIGIAPDGSGR